MSIPIHRFKLLISIGKHRELPDFLILGTLIPAANDLLLFHCAPIVLDCQITLCEKHRRALIQRLQLARAVPHSTVTSHGVLHSLS